MIKSVGRQNNILIIKTVSFWKKSSLCYSKAQHRQDLNPFIPRYGYSCNKSIFVLFEVWQQRVDMVKLSMLLSMLSVHMPA